MIEGSLYPDTIMDIATYPEIPQLNIEAVTETNLCVIH